MEPGTRQLAVLARRCPGYFKWQWQWSLRHYLHSAASFFIGYSYNFCWPVRTLRIKGANGHWQARTQAFAAGLADHVWTTEEWATYPARVP